MVQTVIMPKLGQTVEESTLLKWHKQVGDPVHKGDILFEIETDKAVLEIESFFEGTLLKIIVAAGETVPVTAPVAFIGQPGEPLPEVPKIVRPKAAAQPPPAIPRVDTVAPAQPVSAPTAISPPARKIISPRARKLIAECAISGDPIPGTGPGGRVVEKDVRAYLAARGYDRIKITPAAKDLARREKIDLLALDPSQDRITLEQIRRAIAEKPQPLSKMRQIIAQRLTHSVTTLPHFYVTVAADLTDLLALRQELKKQQKPYSVTDFILKAVALALKEFPAVNSTTDGRSVRWHSHIHLGLAVSIKDGLVVPVIRDADEISLAELHAAAQELALKARDGKLTPAEMTGSTFTVSNMGMLDIENFTAIINPGESAILAVSSIYETPVVRKDQIVIRSLMKMTLSSDHRLVDGAVAARFNNRIKTLLEDVGSWKNMIS